MLLLFVTTGIHRSECVGLKRKDIDENRYVIHIERGGSYTPGRGIVISTPKTANSIRVIPLIPNVLQLLQQFRQQTQQKNPNTFLKEAFIFPGDKGPFSPCDPSAITRRAKRFMKNHSLPDRSPYDLRHS